MSEWKSVKDELPRDNQPVVTVTYVRHLINGYKFGPITQKYDVQTAYYHEDGSVGWSSEYEPDLWLPLPPLPEENEG